MVALLVVFQNCADAIDRLLPIRVEGALVQELRVVKLLPENL